MTLAFFQELREKRLLDLVPADVLDYFHTIHEGNAARNRGILEHVGELASILNRIGVEPVLLKGACHLASGLYSDPAARFMSDIDILVDNDRALECWRLLVSSGYCSDSACANDRREMHPAEWLPELARKGRTGVVELHRREEWRHMLSAASLYEDAQPIAVGGAMARIPHAGEPADLHPRSCLCASRGRPPGGGCLFAISMMRRCCCAAHGDRKSLAARDRPFDHGGEIEALRAGWMMLRSLLQARSRPMPSSRLD